MSAIHIADLSEVLLALGLATTCTELERAIAQSSLQAATGAVLRHLNYNPVQATHVEFYPQSDMRSGAGIGIWEVNNTSAYERRLSQAVTDELQIKNLPIRSITDLRVDYDGRFGKRVGSFSDETIWVEGTDFWAQWDHQDSDGNPICMDGIIRAEGRWPDIPGSVKVTYVAGYSQEELHGQDSVINAYPIVDAVIDESVRRVHKAYSRMKSQAGFVGPLASEGMGDYNYSRDTAAITRLIDGGADLLLETEHKLRDFIRADLGVM